MRSCLGPCIGRSMAKTYEALMKSMEALMKSMEALMKSMEALMKSMTGFSEMSLLVRLCKRSQRVGSWRIVPWGCSR